MLSQLSKTLSTNVAIGGLALLVIGGGGAGATLAASKSPVPKPDRTVEVKDAEATETDKDAAEDAEDEGTRPTDTHGYCVSQVAKAEHSAPTGTGPDKVTHGSLVRAAAHACGKQDKAAKTAKAAKVAKPEKSAKTDQGKAYGRGHGTGRPATVTPGAAPTS